MATRSAFNQAKSNVQWFYRFARRAIRQQSLTLLIKYLWQSFLEFFFFTLPPSSFIISHTLLGLCAHNIILYHFSLATCDKKKILHPSRKLLDCLSVFLMHTASISHFQNNKTKKKYISFILFSTVHNTWLNFKTLDENKIRYGYQAFRSYVLYTTCHMTCGKSNFQASL